MSMTFPPPTMHDIRRLLETRRQQCRLLLELSERQRALIGSGAWTDLIELLGQKQRLLTEVNSGDLSRSDLVQFWREQRESLPVAARRECEQLLAETDEVLSRLVHEEQQAAEALAQRRAKTLHALEDVAQGEAVQQAYAADLAPGTRRHLDVGG